MRHITLKTKKNRFIVHIKRVYGLENRFNKSFRELSMLGFHVRYMKFSRVVANYWQQDGFGGALNM
jgi:hypothetical protein